MEAKRLYFGTILFTLLFFALVQTGCTSQNIAKPTVALTLAIAETLAPMNTLTPTSTPVLAASLTPLPTIDTTQQTWRATAIAIKTAEQAAFQKSWDEKVAQIAKFPTTCEDIDLYKSIISRDGKWLAASCSEKSKTLIVQSKDQTKWVFNLKDFIDPSIIGGEGWFIPLAWSLDNRFLYFTKVIGYSGGISGDSDCFTGGGFYGLYRLHLKTGNLVTFIPSNGLDFPGDQIEFSPNGEYYATDRNGIRVINLINGKEIEIAVPDTFVSLGITKMSWSPDSKFLAFSAVSCGTTIVESLHTAVWGSSTVFVWNALTNQTQILFSTKEMVLSPQSWLDNSKLRFEGEALAGKKYTVTIFEYSLTDNAMIFSGTATPDP